MVKQYHASRYQNDMATCYLLTRNIVQFIRSDKPTTTNK